MHDTYSFLRQLADSWVLLAMTAFFLGACVWAFRPGSRGLHDDAAEMIFRDVEHVPPAPRLGQAGCEKNCPDCACKTLLEMPK